MIRLFTTSLLSLTVLCLAAQTSTSMEVYQIFQAKCASCHSGNEPAAGLDLQGIGASEQARMMNVFSNIYERTPSNGTAAAKGDAYIYPGRPDKSFIFRKANNGLEATVDLDPAEEGQIMPPYGSPPLTLAETEMIRQWIQFGAPTSGTVVDRDVIEDYYENGGLQAFPDGPPPAPAEDEGFQVKMGPFYLAPGEELEFFQKYELELPEDLEVNRLDMEFGTYSHHFIVYDFNGNGADFIPHGLRLDPDHSNIGMVAAIQEPTDLRLPEGTAFRWDDDLVLDLNSHYINYSATMPYQAEVYMNVYTQSTGTAAQEMYTDLLVNLDIYIPNDENEVTESQVINPNYGEIYLWGMMGHTHQYGTSYKAWQRTNFTNEELIYDASCPNGIPGCTSPYFDYHHIPIRYFEPLQPLTMNFANGLRHEASWINDGPTPVWFGPTSQDEMMVMVIM
ncbi:MAG: hypothetical protein AAGA62_10875, partial [Bacteroidota bacterium]